MIDDVVVDYFVRRDIELMSLTVCVLKCAI